MSFKFLQEKSLTFWGVVKEFTYDLVTDLFTDRHKKLGPDPTWSLGRALLVWWMYETVEFIKLHPVGVPWIYWFMLGFMLIGYVFGTKVVTAVLSRFNFTGNITEKIGDLTKDQIDYLKSKDHV